MSELEYEKEIDEMTKAVEQSLDLSAWKKNRKFSSLLTLITTLHNMPKKKIEGLNLLRIRNQILDRIAVPQTESQPGWLTALMPRIIGLGIAGLGTLLIVASLGLGTAVAALQSIPGQTIYPLKKVVENIQLKLTPSDQKASLQLTFADNRIDELQQVLDQNAEGKISDEETAAIVSLAVKNFEKNTLAAVKAAVQQPKVVNRLSDISSKLKTASIQTDGQVKIEIEKALQVALISQDEAIKNLEEAGIVVEDQPIIIPLPDQVTASGQVTATTETSININTAKFLLNVETVYVNLKATDLKIGLIVDIEGLVKDGKTYATKITLVATATEEKENPETNTTETGIQQEGEPITQ
ncbi:MAG: hypothetical protein A3B10_04550 [Candidatus Doudnabacteria bacterium RIFCSPLOWO2_01_FULL_44_21]|uniref:DUF5667 domain-containing protein n=1 Tax=Candidatus Doudnabacteria bacterium RIFCSPLOWO2_01_FULL_44_21 TaxID=1817841 RepID=A0A1F5PYT4_9BACT|nr:MAG: hypothetical protein A3B95_01525 [Candidatus Doudnabacteria bacterium RIFCSPHIGHO2_02_FULL_43_13b]OGE94750.1 MAG: hypothetical protein A3B10_04550 [Candidatus Doudnabacteria bacterium RIFCSPLOWO2_01_FULL_44_21]